MNFRGETKVERRQAGDNFVNCLEDALNDEYQVKKNSCNFALQGF